MLFLAEAVFVVVEKPEFELEEVLKSEYVSFGTQLLYSKLSIE